MLITLTWLFNINLYYFKCIDVCSRCSGLLYTSLTTHCVRKSLSIALSAPYHYHLCDLQRYILFSIVALVKSRKHYDHCVRRERSSNTRGFETLSWTGEARFCQDHIYIVHFTNEFQLPLDYAYPPPRLRLLLKLESRDTFFENITYFL